MKKLILTHRPYAAIVAGLIFILLGLNLNAQEEKRDVSGFTSISFALPCQLEITQGNSESLTLKGDKEDLEKIITRVEGSTLKIYTKNHTGRLGDVTVLVTVVSLDNLSAAGSGNTLVKGKLNTSDFKVDLSGSGDFICGNLQASSVDISLAGSGSVEMGGTVNEKENVNIAGSGNVNAEKLQAKECSVSIAGSGSVKVWVTDKLNTNIVGSGDVYYKGQPLVNANTTGSGRTRSM